MRHLLANIVTYTIAVLLIVGAAMFGRMRSSQFLLTRESAVFESAAAPSDERFDPAVGRSAYVRNCQNCHGATGRGWDQYPPLSPARAHFARPGGREYLVDLHLYGLESDRWRVPMPAMGHMHDVELAAAINHVLTTFGGVDRAALLVRPAEVAARRGQAVRPRDVDARRPDDRPRPGDGTR